MQEDLLRPNLSVEEYMLLAAHLKLGHTFSKTEKIKLVSYAFERYTLKCELSSLVLKLVLQVNEIIECMGLQTCRFVLTNGLSGGQRKRTSIALEPVSYTHLTLPTIYSV